MSATFSGIMANCTSRSFATRAHSLRMWRTPRQLPSSAFDQHYDGNAAGVANLSGRLLERLSYVLTRSADTASTAYELSVPLLAASVLGPAVHNVTPSRATVPVLSERMADALTAERNAGTTLGSVRCWLVGRLLLADTAQSDHTTHGHSTETMLHELQTLGDNDDCYSCWAWSYLVQAICQTNEFAIDAMCCDVSGGDEGESDSCSVNVDASQCEISTAAQQWWRRQLHSPTALSAAYAKVPRGAAKQDSVLARGVDTETNLKHTQWARAAGGSPGDAMWSAVCAASAAASMRDVMAFSAACESIMHISQGYCDTFAVDNVPVQACKSPDHTLSQCVSRCVQPQDFRAWAVSLLHVAASQIETGTASNVLFAAAEVTACSPYALVAASPHPAERLLALGNLWLAEYTRWVAVAAARPAGADSNLREQEKTFKVTVPDAAASLDALCAPCGLKSV